MGRPRMRSWIFSLLSICLRMTSPVWRVRFLCVRVWLPTGMPLRILAPLVGPLQQLAAVDEERALDVAGAQDVGDARAGADVPAVIEGERHGAGGTRHGLDDLGAGGLGRGEGDEAQRQGQDDGARQGRAGHRVSIIHPTSNMANAQVGGSNVTARHRRTARTWSVGSSSGLRRPGG